MATRVRHVWAYVNGRRIRLRQVSLALRPAFHDTLFPQLTYRAEAIDMTKKKRTKVDRLGDEISPRIVVPPITISIKRSGGCAPSAEGVIDRNMSVDYVMTLHANGSKYDVADRLRQLADVIAGTEGLEIAWGDIVVGLQKALP